MLFSLDAKLVGLELRFIVPVYLMSTVVTPIFDFFVHKAYVVYTIQGIWPIRNFDLSWE